MTYHDYYSTEAQALAAISTLPFGGTIELKNGWFHVWANN